MHSKEAEAAREQILIIDTMCLSNKIYGYATITYIGREFNGGVHNTLKLAVYFKPILFCVPKYYKFNEVVNLVNLEVAKNINLASEFHDAVNSYLNNPVMLSTVI